MGTAKRRAVGNTFV
jgi:nucleoside phosphorylase